MRSCHDRVHKSHHHRRYKWDALFSLFPPHDIENLLRFNQEKSENCSHGQQQHSSPSQKIFSRRPDTLGAQSCLQQRRFSITFPSPNLKRDAMKKRCSCFFLNQTLIFYALSLHWQAIAFHDQVSAQHSGTKEGNKNLRWGRNWRKGQRSGAKNVCERKQKNQISRRDRRFRLKESSPPGDPTSNKGREEASSSVHAVW